MCIRGEGVFRFYWQAKSRLTSWAAVSSEKWSQFFPATCQVPVYKFICASIRGVAMSACVSAGWSATLKYLNSYWMDCCEIWCGHSRSPEDESCRLWWAPHFSCSATIRANASPVLRNISACTRSIGGKFSTNIRVSQTMNFHDFGDPLCEMSVIRIHCGLIVTTLLITLHVL